MVQFAFDHYVFRILGHFGPNAATHRDNWSTGFRLAAENSDVPHGVDLTAFLESVAAAIQAFHGNGNSMSGTNNFLDELTIARVGPDGKYDPSTQQTTRRAYQPATWGLGQPTQAFNTAVVISLRTNIPRGIGSNGRTYWPTTAALVDSVTGRLTTQTADSFIASAKALVDAINGSASSQIASTVAVSVVGAAGKTGPARTAHVKRIRCDERLDSIERRENDEPPMWHERTLA